MPDQGNSKPASPHLGDSLTLADAIGIGDLVRWDRADDGRLLLRRLAHSEVASVKGDIFEVAFGGPDGRVCLKLVRGTIANDG